MAPDNKLSRERETDKFDLIDEFLSTKKNESTRRAYAADFRDFFGGVPAAAELGAFFLLNDEELSARLHNYRLRMQAQRLSPATVERRLGALRSLIRYAASVGQMRNVEEFTRRDPKQRSHSVLGTLRTRADATGEEGENLGEGSSSRKARTGKARAGQAAIGKKRVTKEGSTGDSASRTAQESLTPEDLERLIARPGTQTLRGLRDTALLRLLCEGAVHRAQVCHLDVGDFAANGSSLRLRPIPHKNQTEAALPQPKPTPALWGEPPTFEITLSSALQAALVAYLEHSPHSQDTSAPLLTTLSHRTGDSGARLTVDGIYFLIKAYGRKLDRPRLTPRELREAAIFNALKSEGTTGGTTVERVKERFPHLTEEVLWAHIDRLEASDP